MLPFGEEMNSKRNWQVEKSKFTKMSFSAELEHGIGYSCTTQPSLHIHPKTQEFIYVTGRSVVSRSFDDPHQQSFLRGHNGSIGSVALSRNGTFVASGDTGNESDIIVWDYDTLSQVWRFTEHDNGVKLVSFSHDERLLMSIGLEDNRLVIWDLKTGMQIASTDLPKSIGRVNCACWGGFVKNVKRRNTEKYQFATGGDSICMWSLDPYSGELSIEPADSKRNIRSTVCMTFVHVPDSAGRENYEDEWLLCGTTSGDFAAYLVKPNKKGTGGASMATFVKGVPACGGGVVSIVADMHDEKNVLVGGGDGTIACFVYRESDQSWIDIDGTKTSGTVYGLAISETTKDIVAGSTSGLVVRGRFGSLSRQMVPVCANPCGPLTGISFVPKSNTVFATSSMDGMIRVWSTDDYTVSMETSKDGNVINDQKQYTARGSHAPNSIIYPTCLNFTIDAILSGWTDGNVRSHHAGTGELLWVIKDAHTDGVSALKLSNNMRYVVTGGEHGEVRVWEMRNRQLVSHLKEHTRRITRIVLFDDDIHAISCSRDRSFLTWDLRQDKRISAHTQRMGGIHDIALNHDQTIVISMGQERTISFWDLREPSPIISIEDPRQGMHMDEATSIAVSHSGNLFATGGLDNVVKLWCIVDNHRPLLLQNNIGHTGGIAGMSFTEDDKQLVTIGNDGAIFIWNIFPEPSATNEYHK